MFFQLAHHHSPSEYYWAKAGPRPIVRVAAWSMTATRITKNTGLNNYSDTYMI